MAFPRITVDPAVCTGKPCIRGLRFPVARLLGLMAAGETRDDILKAYPYLEPGDIGEALRYAAFSCGGRDRRFGATRPGQVRFLIDMPLSPSLAERLAQLRRDAGHA